MTKYVSLIAVCLLMSGCRVPEGSENWPVMQPPTMIKTATNTAVSAAYTNSTKRVDSLSTYSTNRVDSLSTPVSK